MKNFIVYTNDGSIVRTGSCPSSMFDLQAQDGEFILEGVAPDEANYKVLDEQVVHSPRVSTIEEVQEEIRMQRASLLRASDWTQVPDAPVDQQAWATYRQALRDLPAQYQNETDFANVVFPNPPE